jgi:hypothetical protein
MAIFGRRTIWTGAAREDDIGMALVPLSAEELAQTPTLFASFMGYAGTSYKTFGQLRAIYRERGKALHAAEDKADDLRVDRFIDDMTSNKWKADVVMRIGVFDGIVLAIDGIHRGIAYLACIEEGISPDKLPPLRVDC